MPAAALARNRPQARRSGRRPQARLITPQRPSNAAWAIEALEIAGEQGEIEADRGIEALDRRMQALLERSLAAAAAACGFPLAMLTLPR